MSLAQVPAEIRASTRWVVWRREWRGGRWTKVPYCATRPGVRAAVDDPTTWCAFGVAVAAMRAGHGDGVGFVLGDGFVGVDLDHVRKARTGLVDASSVAIVNALDSYTEVSPSGEGLHVLAHGKLPPGRRRCGHVEMYDGGRFLTVTGRHLAGTPWTLEARTAALAALHASVFGTGTEPPSTPRHRVLVEQNDATLLARARAARNGRKFAALYDAGDVSGYPSPSEADLALTSFLVFWTGGDAARVDALFRDSGLMRSKWDEPRGTQTYGERTIALALARTTNRRTS
jgi:putative DNA primase/helicase